MLGRINSFLLNIGHRYNPDSPAVSILVPVYNVEKYLRQCLDSLCSQTLENLEFICVNDGSTDGSLKILEAYARKDRRFRIIDKANSGYGASMNRGLDAAKGEYIGIVESDDFASPNMFRTLYRKAKSTNCDIVKSNYFEHSSTGERFCETFEKFAYNQLFCPADMPEIVQTAPTIWAAIYRRNMLVESGIRFNETPGASFQDTSFVFKSWVAAKQALLIRRAFLHYRIDNVNSSVKSTSKVFAVCDEFASSERYLENHSERYASFAPSLYYAKFDTYRWNYYRIANEYHSEFAKRWAEEFRQANSTGKLMRSSFPSNDWDLLQELLADPLAFAEKYAAD